MWEALQLNIFYVNYILQEWSGEHAQSLSSTSTTEKFGSSILEQSLTTGCPRQVPACFREGY